MYIKFSKLNVCCPECHPGGTIVHPGVQQKRFLPFSHGTQGEKKRRILFDFEYDSILDIFDSLMIWNQIMIYLYSKSHK